MLLPVVRSWNTSETASATVYRFRLILPRGAPVFCTSSARTPAMVGGPTEVPPVTLREYHRLRSRKARKLGNQPQAHQTRDRQSRNLPRLRHPLRLQSSFLGRWLVGRVRFVPPYRKESRPPRTNHMKCSRSEQRFD